MPVLNNDIPIDLEPMPVIQMTVVSSEDRPITERNSFPSTSHKKVTTEDENSSYYEEKYNITGELFQANTPLQTSIPDANQTIEEIRET